MPEIYECFYGLFQLFRMFPKEDISVSKQIQDCEDKILCDMAENRIKLFAEFGYC